MLASVACRAVALSTRPLAALITFLPRTPLESSCTSAQYSTAGAAGAAGSSERVRPDPDALTDSQGTTSLGPITAPPSSTRSGYAETRLPDTLPTPLRAHIQQVEEIETNEEREEIVDYYQLSRSLFTDEEFTKVVGVDLDEESAKTLNKLVGCLTKEGKKSQAYRIVLDAMAIIRDNLQQEQQAAK